MILKLLFQLVIGLLNIVFGWVSFPDMPEIIVTTIDSFLTALSGGMGFVWLVIPRELVMVGLPVIPVVENFDKLYSIVMWILRKIPFLGMK